MSDYTLSQTYWSRMRDTKSPPTVPWVDNDPAKIDDMLQMEEVVCVSENPRCNSFQRLHDFVRFVTEYVWGSF